MSGIGISLRNFGALCISAVKILTEPAHHRGAEAQEVGEFAQRSGAEMSFSNLLEQQLHAELDVARVAGRGDAPECR